jgi:predicted dinucleotide-binding enzyme
VKEYHVKIAILGTGFMATTVAAGLLKAGHDITFGSRNPAAGKDLPGPAADHADAISGADLVVSGLAGHAALDTLTALRDPLAGKVLLDFGNAVTEQFDLLYPESSLGQLLQTALPATRVVKTLNTIGGPVGVNPGALPVPTAIFLSGDDAAAKATVSGLLSDLGWGTESQIDLGGIATARAAEHYFYLFVSLMGALGTPQFNIAIVR